MPHRVLTLLLLGPLALRAQVAGDDDRRVPLAPVLELRAAVPAQSDPEVQLGAGISLRAGWYVRLAAAALGGAVKRDSLVAGVARIEAAARFQLDPFFEAPGCRRADVSRVCRGYYGGIGLSQRFEGGVGADDPVLLLIVGIESRRTTRGVWAAELGVGGGVRVGATWRPNRRDGYR